MQMQGVVDVSSALTGCCPDIITQPHSTSRDGWMGGECEEMNSGSMSALNRIEVTRPKFEETSGIFLSLEANNASLTLLFSPLRSSFYHCNCPFFFSFLKMTALHLQTFYRASSFVVGSPFCKKHFCHPLLNYSLADTGTLIQSVFQSQRVMNIFNLILLALHAAQLIFPALVSALHFKWKKRALIV